MGLFGSELQTVSALKGYGLSIMNYMKDTAQPLIADEAEKLGVIDKLPGSDSDKFLNRVYDFANSLLEKHTVEVIKKREKFEMLFKYTSLKEYEDRELKEMHEDIFKNRNNFAEKRRNFVLKKQE